MQWFFLRRVKKTNWFFMLSPYLNIPSTCPYVSINRLPTCLIHISILFNCISKLSFLFRGHWNSSYMFPKNIVSPAFQNLYMLQNKISLVWSTRFKMQNLNSQNSILITKKQMKQNNINFGTIFPLAQRSMPPLIPRRRVVNWGLSATNQFQLSVKCLKGTVILYLFNCIYLGQ